MKRSTNFSHTRKPRNAANDIAAFLQDIGVTSTDLRADSRFTVKERAKSDSADHPAAIEAQVETAQCGAQFGDVTNCLCYLPTGHKGDHRGQPAKSDSIANISWQQEDNR